MKVTDAMQSLATKMLLDRTIAYLSPGDIAKQLLERVLADVPEPVQGPFIWSDEEAAALVSLFPLDDEDGQRKHSVVVQALDRAVRTLAAPAVEPLSEYEEGLVEEASGMRTVTPGGLVAIIRKRFPKPEPARKTARELAGKLKALREDTMTTSEAAAFDELVRRAEENGP